MYQPLVPCASCHRHVRASEAACPFCSSALPRAAAREQVVTAGMSRAAVLALGAALSIVACSDDDSGTGTKTGEVGQGGTSAGSSSGGSSSGGASSGGSSSGGASSVGGNGGAAGDTGGGVLYGLPPMGGAAGESAGPVYGAPPPAGAGGAAGGPDDPGSGNADYGAPPKP